MITVYNVMLVTLGTLLAALAILFLMPAYRRRIERFTTERIKRSLPLTQNEIRADKDRLRAEFAIELHKLESKLEDAGLSAARQSIEVNRRDAKITELEQLLVSQKTDTEEHQNARRVLEQTILDRLPKVESRLAEARRMLLQRDGEIASLSESSGRQTQALEQATQINVQLSGEVERLRAALETRAARGRDAIGDPRFDGEVALRSEIEALRAKSRDQALMIERLQARPDGAPQAGADARPEVDRLRAELARVEAQLLEASQNDYSALVAALEGDVSEHQAEIARLKASLDVYQGSAAAAEATAGDMLTAKAEIHALQAQAEEHAHTIDSLRSELAAANERLARQAQHFRDEMRRLSIQQQDGQDDRDGVARGSDGPRRSLAERIAQPRVPKPAEVESDGPASSGGETRAKFLKALNGGMDSQGESGSPQVQAKPADSGAGRPRRARLLERISNLDKSSG